MRRSSLRLVRQLSADELDEPPDSLDELLWRAGRDDDDVALPVPRLGDKGGAAAMVGGEVKGAEEQRRGRART